LVVASPDRGDFTSVDVIDDGVVLRVELGGIVDGGLHWCMCWVKADTVERIYHGVKRVSQGGLGGPRKPDQGLA
jgi:hypothetical protein